MSGVTVDTALTTCTWWTLYVWCSADGIHLGARADTGAGAVAVAGAGAVAGAVALACGLFNTVAFRGGVNISCDWAFPFSFWYTKKTTELD